MDIYRLPLINTSCQMRYIHRKVSLHPEDGRDSRPKHVGVNTTNTKLCSKSVYVCFYTELKHACVTTVTVQNYLFVFIEWLRL